MERSGCAKAGCSVSPKIMGSTRIKMEANATPKAKNKNGAAQTCSRMAVVKIKNSLANTPNGGQPKMAITPIIKPQPTVGLALIRQRISPQIGAGASPAPTISSEIVGATLAVAPNTVGQ